jgi:hypothetical protein
MTFEQMDPKGLIRESYLIEGITAPECRSIFVDWALSLPDGQDQRAALQILLDHYGPGAPDHPTTGLLRDGMAAEPARRRGGRAAKFASM